MRAALLAYMSFVATAQAPSAPNFDVASVRRIANPSGGITHQTAPDSLTLRNVTLGYCIRWAYSLRPFQTYQTVGPDWIDPPHQEFYEIAAKSSAPVPEERLRLMLQTLLADRFRLVLHRESRNLAVFVLVTEPDGPKVIKSDLAEGEGETKTDRLNVFNCRGFSMGRLAEFLGTLMYLPSEARPIVDETGLAGRFDFTLDIQRYYNGSRDERGRIDMEGNVMRALPELGLKLVAKHAPVEVLVIDHVEKMPTAN
jgi:uncharacterized protein (TIGR03435 family)